MAKEAADKAEADRLAKETTDKAEADRLTKETADKAETTDRFAKEIFLAIPCPSSPCLGPAPTNFITRFSFPPC